MATRLPKGGGGWASAPGADPYGGCRPGRADPPVYGAGGGNRPPPGAGGPDPPTGPGAERSPKVGTKRVSRNRLIPLSGLPLPGGATRSAHEPARSAVVPGPGHGYRNPASAPRRGPRHRPRRRLPHRDAGLRVRLRPGVRARARIGAHPDARPGTGRGHPRAHPRVRTGPGAAARPGPTGRRPAPGRTAPAPPARPGTRRARRPGGPDAVRQAHRPGLLAARDPDAAGLRVSGPAAPRRGAARLRRVLPGGERGHGTVGQALRPGLRAGHPADRVHAGRGAGAARRGRLRRAGDGGLRRPGAERRLALRGHADLCADRAGPEGRAHRPASGQPTGDSTAGRAARSAGRPAGAVCRAGAATTGEASAAGGSPARAAYAAIAAPTIPALF